MRASFYDKLGLIGCISYMQCPFLKINYLILCENLKTCKNMLFRRVGGKGGSIPNALNLEKLVDSTNLLVINNENMTFHEATVQIASLEEKSYFY